MSGGAVDGEALLALWNGAGAWLALALALAILSLLVRDNRFARLAQHIFVGASLGYLGAIALGDVLWPRVAAGARAGPGAPDQWINLWLPLALGLLLLAASAERMLAEPLAALPSSWPRWRRLLRGAGALPVALLVGVGVAAGAVGLVQGTLIPQFLEAARQAIPPDSATNGGALASGLLTLLVSVATLLFLTAQPLAHHRLLRAATWIGQRALWLAAGVLFARLAAARFDLLIAQVEYFWQRLQAAGILIAEHVAAQGQSCFNKR